MKKSLIAGAGVAALSMAALPFAGVFAAPGTTKVDTINLTISESCTMTGSAGTTSFSGAAGANLTEQASSAMVIKCNASGGWKLAYSATALSSETDGNTDIAFGKYAESGNSVWSANMAVSGAGTATVGLTYDSTSETGTAASTTTPGDTATGVSITPSYKIHLGTTQGAGSYEGTITYTFDKN